MASARQDAEQLRTAALAKADSLVGEARTEADRLHAEATDAVERAKAEASETLAGISGRRDDLVSQMREARIRLAAAMDQLDDALEQATDQIPEPIEEPAKPTSPPELEAEPIASHEETEPSRNHTGKLDPSPPDPWDLSSSFSHDLFADDEPKPVPRPIPGQALFEETADFDLSIPDIPLIEDDPEDEPT
jgi:hypothetical protein